jgi:hypothetical protein
MDKIFQKLVDEKNNMIRDLENACAIGNCELVQDILKTGVTPTELCLTYARRKNNDKLLRILLDKL